ncbi:MAG TPA: c-type cytochrome [Verrucomicrobiales bacterium]|nr:c-type cytochrome [Verrucomicrobiales bacterium]
MKAGKKSKRKLWIILGLLVVAGLFSTWFAWLKFFREEPEREFADELERFKYGSIGAEWDRGLPYWIWTVLPSVFPDLTPGPGGYKSFGLVWEEGEEMPVGFTKRVIGFPRVANNCAICHTGTWRSQHDETPHVIPTAPSHTTDVQGMIRFLANSAKDSRFNADTLLDEIKQRTELSWVDQLIYRFILIPATRKELLRQDEQFAWMNRPGWPEWGKGRDDPMNLTKYFMTSMPVDDTTGQADFPSVWNLKIRKGQGLYLNWSCDTPAVRSVLIDSALGLGAAPDERNPLSQLAWRMGRRRWFLNRMAELDATLSETPPPAYPFPVDAALAAQGEAIYRAQCADCHDAGGSRTNRPIPISEVGTDRERMDTWTQGAADEANRRVRAMGIFRANMVKIEGYQSPPLDGIWMRAPYLHNGSVPTMRELLEPVELRTKVFYRGYDVYDPVNMGFVVSGPEAEREGWRHDVEERGNGNGGHLYGVDLTPGEKQALLEYMKGL